MNRLLRSYNCGEIIYVILDATFHSIESGGFTNPKELCYGRAWLAPNIRHSGHGEACKKVSTRRGCQACSGQGPAFHRLKHRVEMHGIKITHNDLLPGRTDLITVAHGDCMVKVTRIRMT